MFCRCVINLIYFPDQSLIVGVRTRVYRDYHINLLPESVSCSLDKQARVLFYARGRGSAPESSTLGRSSERLIEPISSASDDIAYARVINELDMLKESRNFFPTFDLNFYNLTFNNQSRIILFRNYLIFNNKKM